MFLKPHYPLTLFLVAMLPSLSLADDLRVEVNKAQGASNLQTITLEGDALFEFNQATLSSKGRAALDKLIKSNALFPLDRYRIVGHTDNLGSPRLNQQLSQRRAETIERYLKQANVNLKLESIGAGDSRPKVVCAHDLAPKQRVKCLAPNRRVEIERISTP